MTHEERRIKDRRFQNDVSGLKPRTRGLYLLLSEADESYIKVGYTEDMKHRIRAIEAGNPHVLSVIHIAEAPHDVGVDRIVETERQLKMAWERHCHRHEWFYCNDETTARIRHMFRMLNQVKETDEKWRIFLTWVEEEVAIARVAVVDDLDALVTELGRPFALD